MNIEYISISEIKPYEDNPRKNDKSVQKVAESIKEFGFNVPITVDKDNVIVTGHTRYKAAKRLKLKEVPIIRLDLTEEQISAYRLADNKAGEDSEWDLPLLDKELKDLEDSGIDMSLFGFEREKGFEDAHEDDYEIKEPETPKTKLGDIYVLGNHRLMCGDSTKAEDAMKLMDGKEADLWLTDPPYNVDVGSYDPSKGEIADGSRRILNDSMDEGSFLAFLTKAFTVAFDYLKSGGGFYIFHSESEGLSFRTACEESGLKIRECLIWKKDHFTLGRQDYQWVHEPCLYGWKDGAGHYWNGGRSQDTFIESDLKEKSKEELIEMIKSLDTSVIECEKPIKSELHPTMKPIKLCARLIANSSKEGEIVLDTFGGSGSTLIACEQLGRKCYTMELDPKYCDVIVDRWEKLTGRKAELLNARP